MDDKTCRTKQGAPLAVIALTFSLFALWGVGHRLYDTLIPQFARAFSLTGFALAIAGGVYSMTYLLWPVPAALCARRFGYKACLVLGLGIACIGAFLLYPAGESRSFLYFITAVTVMCVGWVLLEVAANPLVIALGSTKNAVQRLNLAQSIYVPGSLLGLAVGRWLIQHHQAASAASVAQSLAHPYIVFAAILLVLAIVVVDTHYPPAATARLRGFASEWRTLLARPQFVCAVAAQGFSVIAMASTWTVAPMLLRDASTPGWLVWGGVGIWSMVLFGVGRFLGTGLMTWISPERLLAAYSLCGAVASIVAFALGGPAAALILLASNLVLSILWPTILGLAIRDLGDAMKIATAFICMGGALGGFAHRLISVFVYPVSPRLGLLVVATAYAAVLLFAWLGQFSPPDKARRTAL